MAARTDSVCRFICEKGGWKVTNLQLQKILYLAQMIYMGRSGGERLVDTGFEAWDYGPVSPEVYHKVRMFGARSIEDVFFHARPFSDEDPRRETLEEACNVLLPMSAGKLVEITHWKDGAWATHYEPGVRGLRIPDDDIFAEYGKRIRAGNLTDD